MSKTITKLDLVNHLNKKERPGRNPRTGEPAVISARRVVTFKAGQKLRKKMSNIQSE